MNGQIATIHVKEGQRASKGQLLVSLKTDVTESNIQEVKTSLDLANKMYEKQKDLWEQKVGSEVQYLQAKNQKESLEARLNTLRAQLDMARVKAPFAGIVEEIFQKEGELGTPGRQIIQLVNLNKLKLNASVSESYLSMVEAGDTVRVTFPAFPGMVKYLPISRTGKVIDPANRTFDIELAMRNPAEKLKPNMLAVVRLNDYTNPSAFVVPSNAISQDIKGKFLFTAQVTDSITLAEKVYVKPGKSYGNQSEIQKGLKPGDKVVVSGYNLVSSGSELNIKEVR
jgi:RND family efflux transporter MFP subunit